MTVGGTDWSSSLSATTSPATFTATYTGAFPVAAGVVLPALTVSGTLNDAALGRFTASAVVSTPSDSNPGNDSGSDTINVADAALTPGGLTPPVGAAPGTPLSNMVLFHFSDADPGGTAADFKATVTWGDGTVEDSVGNPADVQVVASSGGGFDVLGSHTYLRGGVLSFGVAVADQGGAATSASGTVTISTDAAVAGTSGDDTLRLSRAAGGPVGSVSYVLNGGAPVALSNITSFTFDGGAGDDTFTVGYGNGPPLPGGGIAFDGGSGVNALVVDDSAGAAATTLTLTGGQVTTQDGAGTVAVSYLATGGRIGSVEVLTGTGNDLVLVRSTTAGATTAVSSGGAGNIYVSSAVGNNGTLGGLRGPLVIDGGAGSNFLTVSAAGDSGPDTFTLTGSSITDTAAGLRIAYGASGGGFAGVNLATGPGAVRVNVQGTAAGAITGVLNLGGADTIDVCSDTATNMGDLSGLKGTLLVEALGGTDLLVASEAGRQTRDDVVVTAGALGSRDGAGFTIDYAAAGGGSFSGLNFAAGAGDDHFTVQGAPAGAPVALYNFGGADTVVVGVTPDSGYRLTVVGRSPESGAGSAVLGVADEGGAAAIDNMGSGLDSGLVRLLYAGGKPSTITYLDVDQVFTTPAAG